MAASRPEPMNASPSHSKVKLTVSFSDALYVAGKSISGKLEMESRADGDKGLGIGVIAVEVFGIQELTSRDHSATSTFLHSKRLFQGPGLPPSNAVEPFPLPTSQTPQLPENYFPARRGTSTFLFQLPIPDSSPSTIAFGNALANVRYLVRATVAVFWRGERKLVTCTREVDVVDQFEEDFARVEPEGVVVGENGKVWVMGRVVGGMLIAGDSACVELLVKNHSSKKNANLSLTLTRTLLLPGANGAPEKMPISISDTLANVSFKGPDYIVGPGIEGVASLVFDVPKSARVVKGGTFGVVPTGKTAQGQPELGEVDAIFEVQAQVEVRMGMGFGSKDIVLTLPVHILHPAALPELLPPPPVLGAAYGSGLPSPQSPYAAGGGHSPGTSTPPQFPVPGSPNPYAAAYNPPYSPMSPGPPAAPYAYANLPPPAMSSPYVDPAHGQVWLPPPQAPFASPVPGSPNLSGYASPQPAYVPPPSVAPGARPLPPPTPGPGMGLGLNTGPQRQEPKPESQLPPMPTAQPKSAIHRANAPGSIALPSSPSAQQGQVQSNNTGGSLNTPLLSPRPMLSPKASAEHLGSRGKERSERVEVLERIAAEEGGEGEGEKGVSEEARRRIMDEVERGRLGAAAGGKGEVQERERKVSTGNGELKRDKTLPGMPVSSVQKERSRSKAGEGEYFPTSEEKAKDAPRSAGLSSASAAGPPKSPRLSTGSAAPPKSPKLPSASAAPPKSPRLSSASVAPPSPKSPAKELKEEKVREDEGKLRVMRNEGRMRKRSIEFAPTPVTTKATSPATNGLLGVPGGTGDANKSSNSSRNRNNNNKMPKSLLADLAALPSEDTLELPTSSPARRHSRGEGGLGGGLDALEKRLLMEVGTRKVEERGRVTALEALAADDDETTWTATRSGKEEREGVKIHGGRRAVDPDEEEAREVVESAISSLTLAGAGPLAAATTEVGPPPTRLGLGYRRVSVESAATETATARGRAGSDATATSSNANANDRRKRKESESAGEKRMKKKASSNRVEAWLGGIAADPKADQKEDEEEEEDLGTESRVDGLPGAEVDVVTPTILARGVVEKVEDSSNSKEKEVEPGKKDKEQVKEDKPNPRSSGFISFEAHAKNTYKSNSRIIANARSGGGVRLNELFSPAGAGDGEEKKPAVVAGKDDGGVKKITRERDARGEGETTFQRIRAAFSRNEEEERMMRNVNGIWAGAMKSPSSSVAPGANSNNVATGVKHAWDAEAEAITPPLAGAGGGLVRKRTKDAKSWITQAQAQAAEAEDGEGPKYDVRSARGGRGGKVADVMKLWGGKSGTRLDGVLEEEDGTSNSTGATTAGGGAGATKTSAGMQKRRSAPPAGMIKSSSVPALLSSSTAGAVLSSTASLARPAPAPSFSAPLVSSPAAGPAKDKNGDKDNGQAKRHRSTQSLGDLNLLAKPTHNYSRTRSPSPNRPKSSLPSSLSSSNASSPAPSPQVTGTGAGTKPPLVAPKPKVTSPLIGRQPPAPLSPPSSSAGGEGVGGTAAGMAQSTMAFGQAKLRDLIKKYQGAAAGGS